MNYQTASERARSHAGAGLPPRNLGFRILACGHPRIVAENVPAITRLYCDECIEIRPQAEQPLSPEFAHELAAARWRFAGDRLTRVREYTAALLAEAEDDLDHAQIALCALEASPGIPLYTQHKETS